MDRRPSMLHRISGMLSSSLRMNSTSSIKSSTSFSSTSYGEVGLTSFAVKPSSPRLLQAKSVSLSISEEASSAHQLPTKIMDDIPMIGVSLKWFVNFLSSDEDVIQMMHAKGDKATVNDLADLIRSMTSEEDESLAQMLLRKQPLRELTKPVADVYVSYTRTTSVKDLHSALKTLLDGDHLLLFIWIDVLCINQRYFNEFNYDFFAKKLSKKISNISNMAAILSPVNDLDYFSRLWCLWELYISVAEAEGVNVQYLMPASQQAQLREELIHHPEKLYNKVSCIDVTKARASSDKNRNLILDAAKKTKDGLQGVNDKIVKSVRNWITREAINITNFYEQELNQQSKGYDKETYAKLLSSTAMLLDLQGRYNEAEAKLKTAFDIYKSMYRESNIIVPLTLFNVALTVQSQKRFEEAELLMREVLVITQVLLGRTSLEAGIIMDALGTLLTLEKDFDKAIEFYHRSIRIQKQHLGCFNDQLASTLDNLGHALYAKGQYNEAAERHLQALETRLRLYGKSNNNGDASIEIDISVFNCMSSFLAKRDFDAVEQLYSELSTITLNSSAQSKRQSQKLINEVKDIEKLWLKEATNHLNRCLQYTDRIKSLSKTAIDITKTWTWACEGRLLFFEEKYDESETMLQKSLNKMTEIEGVEYHGLTKIHVWIDENQKAKSS